MIRMDYIISDANTGGAWYYIIRAYNLFIVKLMVYYLKQSKVVTSNLFMLNMTQDDTCVL